MTKIVFMGTGAAPGVPSLSRGWKNCNPNNEKNRRRRIGTYIEIENQKFLIDTSPDLRAQLLENDIIVVVSGCSAQAAAKAGLLDPDARCVVYACACRPYPRYR